MEHIDTTTITIDNREKDLIDYMEAMYTGDAILKIAPLPVGDIVVSKEGYHIVLERKTWADLVSSVHDGRYRDQKQRLGALDGTHRVAYVIERGRVRKNSDVNLVRSTILSISVRDGVAVIQSDGIDDTAAWIASIAKRLGKGTLKGRVESVPSPGMSLAASGKRCASTAEECLAAQLAQVRGVSLKSAGVVAKRFGSMAAFCREATVKVVSDLRVGGRRMGAKRAERMLALCGIHRETD